MSNPKRDVLCLRFNQEQNLFACSTDSGLRIYNVDPLVVKTHLDPVEVGTISVIEFLHRSNFIGLVSGGSKPKFAENTVLIWDDSLKKFVIEITFGSPVLNIRMRKDMLFVVEAQRVHIFSFPHDCKKLLTYDTKTRNPRGLFEISLYPSSERQVCVFPGHQKGTVQVVDLATIEPDKSCTPVNINAHEHDIACLALNSQGTMVATASSRGTLIRVFDTVKKNQLIELRRGTDSATLYCISFSRDSDFLCASSDKGTIHIFALRETHLNRRSTFAKVGGLGIGSNYIDSQWGLTNFTVEPELACVCGFGPKGSVYAVCVDGTFHKYIFNPDGSCIRDSYDVFVDLPEEDEF